MCDELDGIQFREERERYWMSVCMGYVSVCVGGWRGVCVGKRERERWGHVCVWNVLMYSLSLSFSLSLTITDANVCANGDEWKEGGRERERERKRDI